MTTTPNSTDPHPRWRYLPWRRQRSGGSSRPGLIAGVPLFLCMPPWNDVTLHDMAVRSMLRGGVTTRRVRHELAGNRLGDGRRGSRSVGAMKPFARRSGRDRGRSLVVARLGSARAQIYRSVARGVGRDVLPLHFRVHHVQRDPWLLLPALVAVRLRLWRGSRQFDPSATGPSIGFSCLEGLSWGARCGSNHVIVPAFAIWLVSVYLLAHREPRRLLLIDLGGLLLGGSSRVRPDRVAGRNRRVAALPRHLSALEPRLLRRRVARNRRANHLYLPLLPTLEPDPLRRATACPSRVAGSANVDPPRGEATARKDPSAAL